MRNERGEFTGHERPLALEALADVDQGAGQVIRRRCFREFERGILDLVCSQRRMLYRQIHFPVAELGVMFHPVFGALYGESANTGRRAALCQLVLPQRHAPLFDVLVQFLLVLQASEDSGKFPRDGPRRSAHRLH